MPWLTLAVLLQASPLGQVHPRDRRGPSDYLVVVTKSTYARPEWKEVVEALLKKRSADLFVCDDRFTEAEKPLASTLPRFACFVARPDELGRDPVVAINRMMRRLDPDPYTDARWGILTGYDPADAKRVAERSEPLLVRRGAAGCGIDLSRFESGVWFSESEKNVKWEKRKGSAPEKKTCPDDATAEIVAELNAGNTQAFVTSGHATARDWQIGYSFKSGQLRCEDGRLFGLDVQGRRHDIDSPNPKVYLAAGNCLMGLIPDRDAMALAWMHSGGAYQVVGYVAVSLYGSIGGLATKEYFESAGFPLSDAFFATQQWIVYELETRFPKIARVDIGDYDVEANPALIATLAQKLGIRERDELLLLWDRDTLAFYGDPAWSARVETTSPLYDVKLTERNGSFTFEATSLVEGAWSRPPFAFLPRRLKGVQVTEGEGVVTGSFVMLPVPAKVSKRQKIRVAFKEMKEALDSRKK